jgi:CRISPR-associated endonuclease Cas1
VPVACRQCGTPFQATRNRRFYCSAACYRIWWQAHIQRDAAEAGVIRRTARPPTSSTTAQPAPADPASAPGEQDAAEVDADDTEWADRGDYWAAQIAQPIRPVGKRKLAKPQALVLAGHGVQLRVQAGTLLVHEGLTHFPQRRREHRFFPGDRALPSRIIVLDGDGSISFDVVAWLAHQRVPLIVLNWRGEVVSILGADTVGPDPQLRQVQIAALTDGRGLHLATQLIREKLIASMATLETLEQTTVRERAFVTLDTALTDLRTSPPRTIEALRLVEARAALAYFRTWQTISLRWKGTGRKPVPPEWQRIGLRQSMLGKTNEHATHPINAMLNYAYAVLESQVRIAAIAAGFDPTIGYLHASYRERVALAYDLMEPLRPVVDRAMLTFTQTHTLATSDFVLTGEGICRLHPQLARTVVAMVMTGAEVQRVVTAAAAHLGAGA